MPYDEPTRQHRRSTPPVLCISHGFLTNYERGFCNGLAIGGIDVTLLSSDNTDVGGLFHSVKSVNIRGSQERNRPRWKKALNIAAYNLRLLAATLTQRGSIFHVIGVISPPIWYGIILGAWFRLLSRQYVLTVHNLLPHDAHTRFNRVTFGWAYRLPHHLVVHTERMKEELAGSFGISRTRMTVMQHGLEPQPVLADDRVSRQDARVPTILIFGRIAPYKGVDVLLEALNQVGFPFRLVIAGSCPDAAFRAQLQSLIRSHQFRDAIEWHDRYVPEPEMEQMFAGAQLLALPYRHIDQSGVLFQGLRFGLPIVATRVGEFENVVTEAVGELAAPGDAVGLAAALERWAARRHELKPEHIRQLGKAYEWPLTVGPLCQAYEALAS